MLFIRNYLTRRKLNILTSSLKENGDVVENVRQINRVLHTLYTMPIPITYAEATLMSVKHTCIRDVLSVLTEANKGASRGTHVEVKGDFTEERRVTLYDFCLIDNSSNYIDPSNIISTLCPVLDELIFNLSEHGLGSPLHDYYSRVLRRVTKDLHVLATCIYGANKNYESKRRKES